MKKSTSSPILGAVGVVLFVVTIALKSDSAGDWMVGLGLLAAALLVGWGLTKLDSPAAGSGPDKIAGPAQPGARVAGQNAMVAVCSGCGARSTGTRFCPECGKPFERSRTCSQCGAEVQSGIKFCPECGTKIA